MEFMVVVMMPDVSVKHRIEERVSVLASFAEALFLDLKADIVVVTLQ
jgi:hypothetical protein